MLNLAATIAAMKEAGMADDAILVALSCLKVEAVSVTADEQAERRRAKDRERKQRLRNSAESADTLSLDKKVSPHPFKEINPIPKEKTPKGVQKKGVRLTADWSLPTEWRADAEAAGLPPHLIDREAERMRDWSLSSKAGAKLDWRAAWRNWAKSAAERLPQARGSPPREPSIAERAFALAAEMERADGRENSNHQLDWQAALRLPAS